jgi:DivIVA domain-containing protein
MDTPPFRRVKWQQGYDIAEVDAFVARLEAAVDGRPGAQPVTVDEIRNVAFRPVRFREGYAIEDVDDFLDLAVQSLSRGQVEDRSDGERPTDSRRQREAPRFNLVKLREGYDMAEVDDFVDRVMATVNGQPVDRPVTSREIRTVRFSPVRIREGYDVMEVDLFLETVEGWLDGA